MTIAEQIEGMKRALTAPELAELLAVSEKTIYAHARANRIPSFKVGNAVRFDPKAVAVWLAGKNPSRSNQ